MNHSRNQMRACSLAWRLTGNPLLLAAALLWREKARGGVRLPVASYSAPAFLVPVARTGANPRATP